MKKIENYSITLDLKVFLEMDVAKKIWKLSKEEKINADNDLHVLYDKTVREFEHVREKQIFCIVKEAVKAQILFNPRIHYISTPKFSDLLNFRNTENSKDQLYLIQILAKLNLKGKEYQGDIYKIHWEHWKENDKK